MSVLQSEIVWKMQWKPMKTMAEVLKLVKRKSFFGVWYQVCFKKNKNKTAPSSTVIPKHTGCQLVPAPVVFPCLPYGLQEKCSSARTFLPYTCDEDALSHSYLTDQDFKMSCLHTGLLLSQNMVLAIMLFSHFPLLNHYWRNLGQLTDYAEPDRQRSP